MSAKLSSFREKHAIWYSLIAVLLFIVVNMILSPILRGLDQIGFMPADEQTYEYAAIIIRDLVVALVMLLMMRLTNRANLMKGLGANFRTCFMASAFKVVYALVVLAVLLPMSINSDMTLRPFGMILLFVVSMLVVGLMEEMMFRGVVAETMLEHFGTDTKGVFKAALLSGTFFGLIHLVNLTGSAPVSSVVLQSVANISSGFLLAAIYYRCGSMWTMVLVHALNNISAGATNGFFELAADATSTTALDSTIGNTKLAPAIIQFILQAAVAVFLLRSKKNAEVQKIWSSVVVSKNAE